MNLSTMIDSQNKQLQMRKTKPKKKITETTEPSVLPKKIRMEKTLNALRKRFQEMDVYTADEGILGNSVIRVHCKNLLHLDNIELAVEEIMEQDMKITLVNIPAVMSKCHTFIKGMILYIQFECPWDAENALALFKRFKFTNASLAEEPTIYEANRAERLSKHGVAPERLSKQVSISRVSISNGRDPDWVGSENGNREDKIAQLDLEIRRSRVSISDGLTDDGWDSLENSFSSSILSDIDLGDLFPQKSFRISSSDKEVENLTGLFQAHLPGWKDN